MNIIEGEQCDKMTYSSHAFLQGLPRSVKQPGSYRNLTAEKSIWDIFKGLTIKHDKLSELFKVLEASACLSPLSTGSMIKD